MNTVNELEAREQTGLWLHAPSCVKFGLTEKSKNQRVGRDFGYRLHGNYLKRRSATALNVVTGNVDFEAVKKPSPRNGIENFSQLEAR